MHLAIEVIELSFEHFAEAAFGLSSRDAQVVTAWTGLILMAYLATKLLQKVCVAAKYAIAKAPARLKELKESAVSYSVGHRLELVMAAAAIVVYLTL
ncbi:hypothetical protein [Methylocaldum sp.]|uniref:hypothetical protein n=1 Tax=Methylocaldum sp. TaxID=1969727 RepID=UPI0032203EE3